MHFIIIEPVYSDHMFYVTLFQYSLGRSHKTGFPVNHFIITIEIHMYPLYQLNLFFVATCIRWLYINIPLGVRIRHILRYIMSLLKLKYLLYQLNLFSVTTYFVTLFQYSLKMSHKTGFIVDHVITTTKIIPLSVLYIRSP